MGKIDDMRRQREARLAQADRAATGDGAAAPDEPAPPIVVDGEPTGACSVCGKVRPLQGGLVGSHQKGLGKFCPGSRKLPA